VSKLVHAGRSPLEARESAEARKLAKKLAEAEEEQQAAYDAMVEANVTFAQKMPKCVSQYGLCLLCGWGAG
jgi:DNA-directed RNA polymerase sigma subunit (sigma70/sigma32)